jgi:hypothetical protein
VGDTVEEDGWVSVSFHPDDEMRSFRAFEIDVVDGGGGEALSSPPPPAQEVNLDVGSVHTLEGCFGDFLGKMRMDSMELVNLDTTALVAIVSGISNGGVGKLMSAPEAETRGRFKCNYKFVMDQVLWKRLLLKIQPSRAVFVNNLAQLVITDFKFSMLFDP